MTKTLNAGSHDVTLQVWDTAGQERYFVLLRYFRTQSVGFCQCLLHFTEGRTLALLFTMFLTKRV